MCSHPRWRPLPTREETGPSEAVHVGSGLVPALDVHDQSIPCSQPAHDATMHLSMRPAATARGARQPHHRIDARQLIFDVKTIHAGGSHYRSARARDEQSGGLAERAHQVQSAYEGHARRLDRRISERNPRQGGLGAGPDDTTDVFDHLAALGRSFTRVRGLICGNYGERSRMSMSSSPSPLMAWQRVGSASWEHDQPPRHGPFFIARLRRSLSVVIAREMARHRLRRIPFIGMPRAAIRDRPPQRAQPGVLHLPHDGPSSQTSCATRCTPPSQPSPCTPKRAAGVRARAGR